MFTHNPFAELSGFITPLAMQLYVVLMFLLVLGGTLLDTLHKKSAKYFFQNAEKSKKNRTRTVGGGEKAGIAVKTVVEDVLTSAEFCNAQRRIAHLLGMYGFVTFIVTTALLIFWYPTAATPAPPLDHNIMALKCSNGVRWWLLVLVLYPGGCRCRGQSLVSGGARGLVYPVAARDSNLRPDLVSAAVFRWLCVASNAFLCFVHNCQYGPVWWRAVVQVRSHVLQTRRCVSKAHGRSRWLKIKPASSSRCARTVWPGY